MISLPPAVAFLAPRSLMKYTSGILAKGFGALGYDIVPFEDASFALILVEAASLQEDINDSDTHSLLRLLAQHLDSEITPQLVLSIRSNEVGTLSRSLSVIESILKRPICS